MHFDCWVGDRAGRRGIHTLAMNTLRHVRRFLCGGRARPDTELDDLAHRRPANQADQPATDLDDECPRCETKGSFHTCPYCGSRYCYPCSGVPHACDSCYFFELQ